MGLIRSIICSVLSASSVYMYMTDHFIKANWIALLWIAVLITEVRNTNNTK